MKTRRELVRVAWCIALHAATIVIVFVIVVFGNSSVLRAGDAQSKSRGNVEVDLQLAETVLLYQRASGGWPKNYDRQRVIDEKQRARLLADRTKSDATIDNGATYEEIRIIAAAFNKTRDKRFYDSCIRGIVYLLEAQYDNGGWPQTYPDPRGYARHITFNDNAMIGVMRLLRDVGTKPKDFPFVDQELRDLCKNAVRKGVACILKCQIVVNGEPTVWCAQHDSVTLKPAKARSYELPSFSGSESVEITRFLMELKPKPPIARSIEGAVAWFERSKIEGIRVERVERPDTPKGYDKIIVNDPNARPMWARFYDLKTNQPFFCDRDGVPKARLSEISYERRNGYSWLGYYAEKLLAVDYPAWKAKKSRYQEDGAQVPRSNR